MAIKNEIVDELLKDADPKKVLSSEGLLSEIKKALAERMLNAELDQHLEGEAAASEARGEPSGNHRNGNSKKTVITDTSQVELEIPRDRRGTFEPQLIAKYQRRFPGFDDKITSMYARGMSVRDIQGHLRELYGIAASPQLISTVTNAVLEEVGRWQSRPLDTLYAIVYFDALRVKMNDMLIAVVDGLKGFPDAIIAVFPEKQIQTCIVHLLRNSMDYAGWKDRKPVATALKVVYRAPDAEAASIALIEFEEGPWGHKYPAITAAWRRNWEQVIPFFAYPPEVRRTIYTTNAIESLNSTIRRSVRARGHFPSDEAAMKLIWLQLREIKKNWKTPAREWHAAKAQFALLFGDRFEMYQ
jgi:putative transposase